MTPWFRWFRQAQPKKLNPADFDKLNPAELKFRLKAEVHSSGLTSSVSRLQPT
ncbi:hypothetical protein HYR99_00950 [Candidatus Poribacteria bacterium]|nr:hypothetical protein [Candidatus Poribacteria bacterium]